MSPWLPDEASLHLHDREQLSRKLRISLVSACNLACTFCHNEGQGSLTRLGLRESLRVEDYVRIVDAATSAGISEVKLTGGEPLLYRDGQRGLVDLVHELNRLRADRHFGLSMTTNGLLLPKVASELKEAGLDRVTVSLHTLNRATFKKVIGPNSRSAPEAAVRGIEAAIAAGLTPVKVNAVLFHNPSEVSNISELESIVALCRGIGVTQLRFYTLLRHDAFVDHAELYQYWDDGLLGRIGTALYGDGPHAQRYKVTASAFVREWSRQLYPKPTLIARAGSFEIAIEAMEAGRFDGMGVSDEGPYALRLSADGKLRGMNEEDTSTIDIIPLLSGLSNDTLRQAFEQGRRCLLP
ncbi:radical SAM protein [Micromonospora arida]|uniref:radical SAM protein n=1 Tax=Micromonospora arida TaxID=2203715 RepID=UPI003CE846E7